VGDWKRGDEGNRGKGETRGQGRREGVRGSWKWGWGGSCWLGLREVGLSEGGGVKGEMREGVTYGNGCVM